MSYRDDVDTLYTRAMILQRELDAAQAKIAERDAELARMRGGSSTRAPTSPGMRTLRELPDVDEARSRLVNTSVKLSPLPMPNWAAIGSSLPHAGSTSHRSQLVELVRDRVALLSSDDLGLVSKIVAELTDKEAGIDEELRKRLRGLASDIAASRR
jgi:hypothetical protein